MYVCVYACIWSGDGGSDWDEIVGGRVEHVRWEWSERVEQYIVNLV